MTVHPETAIAAFDRDATHNRGYLYTTNAALSSVLANRRLTDAALRAVDFRGKRVLDVGCGDGAYTIDLFDGGRPSRMYGFDPSAEAIAVAREKVSSRPIRFEVSDGSAVPLADHEFDVAHLRGVLHHAEHPRELLREAFRLAPVLLVLEPNGYNPVLKVIEKASRYHREHGEKSFSARALDRWIRELGGRVVSRHWVGLVPFFCPDPIARVLKALEPVVEHTPILNAAGCAVYVQVSVRDA